MLYLMEIKEVPLLTFSTLSYIYVSPSAILISEVGSGLNDLEVWSCLSKCCPD